MRLTQVHPYVLVLSGPCMASERTLFAQHYQVQATPLDFMYHADTVLGAVSVVRLAKICKQLRPNSICTTEGRMYVKHLESSLPLIVAVITFA